MNIKVPLFGFLLSLLLLSALIALRPEWFLFYKTVGNPIWADYLPRGITHQSFLAVFALLPAVSAAVDFRRAAASVLLALSISPLVALVIYALERAHQQALLNLIANVVFHYFWIIGFHLLLPAAGILCVRLAWQLILNSNAIFKR